MDCMIAPRMSGGNSSRRQAEKTDMGLSPESLNWNELEKGGNKTRNEQSDRDESRESRGGTPRRRSERDTSVPQKSGDKAYKRNGLESGGPRSTQGLEAKETSRKSDKGVTRTSEEIATDRRQSSARTSDVGSKRKSENLSYSRAHTRDASLRTPGKPEKEQDPKPETSRRASKLVTEALRDSIGHQAQRMSVSVKEYIPTKLKQLPENLKGKMKRKHAKEAVDILLLGERGSGFRKQTDVQDFYKIRDECLAEGKLWEDPEFEANDSSIFFSRSPPKPFEWKRPMEISDNPRLFVEGYSRFDVQQGELGDCWLLAAVANLTLQPTLFSQVVPNDQSFREKYAGVFHFRFWQYGRWVDVVVDDRLPTCYGKLVYLHSSENNEFWSALLEKAYAKLHGSYEALKGGSTNEAMEDFTGGVTEMYDLASAPSNLYHILLKAFERNSLMGCSIEPDPSVTEMQTSDGLVKGHAYSITSVKYVDINTPNTQGKIPLLRLRNPWGNEAEWTGPWSDRSPEWRYIPEAEKQEIGLVFEEDGEFWMSYRDFTKHFMRLEICNLNPDSLTEDELAATSKKRWEASVFEGEWVRGVTAGGCRNFLQTFSRNPQYRITLVDVDDEDDDNKCTVIVGLMQKNRRSQRRLGQDCLTIGFAVYALEDPDNLPTPLDTKFFTYNASVARSQSFINMREVSCRFTLPPGVYCIVPSTFEPTEEGEFLLRVFSEKKNNMEENDDEVGLKEMDDRVIEPPQPAPEMKKNDEKVKEFFRKLAGEDMEVDWVELKEILDYAMRNEVSASSGGDNIIMNLFSQICGTFFQESPLASVFDTVGKGGFSKDICRSMIAMLDADHSGKLGFDEFKQLWVDIRHWKSIYQMYSKETQGYLSAFELREALNSAGYRLNNHILNILAHRYAGKDGRISFDDFMMCAVKLKTMIEYFKDKDTDDSNKVMFSLEEWVEKTLYS